MNFYLLCFDFFPVYLFTKLSFFYLCFEVFDIFLTAEDKEKIRLFRIRKYKRNLTQFYVESELFLLTLSVQTEYHW